MPPSGSYDAVEHTKLSRLDELRALGTILKTIVIAAVASIPIFFKWIFQLFSPTPLKNISGQLALVTGGSAGIGRAIALRLAKHGCRIAIVNRNLEMGRKVAEEIRSQYKVDAAAFEADVSKRDDVKRLKREVEESLGNVDILVNNAGLLSLENSLLEGDDEDYQNVVDVNLTSYFWTARAFLPGMMERRRGHIVAISSLITKLPIISAVCYTSTKFGNLGFMEALHEDLNFYGYGDCIKTTTVLPGIIATQKKHKEMIETISEATFINVHACAKDVVNGILRNRRIFLIPPAAGLFKLLNWFPDDAVLIAKRSMLKTNNVEKFQEIRAKK